MERAVAFAGAALGGALAILACSSFGADSRKDAGDGGLDAGGDLGAGDAMPCEAGTFCDGFDENEALGARWTRVEKNGTWTFELDSKTSRSSPRSLHIVLQPAAGGDVAHGYLVKDLAVPSMLVCSFAVLVRGDYRGSGTPIDLIEIVSRGPGIDEHYLDLGGTTGELRLREDFIYTDGGCTCPLHSDEIIPSMKRGDWFRIRLETNFATVRLFIDDMFVFTGAYGGFKPTELRVQLGLITASTTSTADVSLDDFVCELRN